MVRGGRGWKEKLWVEGVVKKQIMNTQKNGSLETIIKVQLSGINFFSKQQCNNNVLNRCLRDERAR